MTDTYKRNRLRAVNGSFWSEALSVDKPRLAFNELATKHQGVTPEVAANYSQAACVCLDRHHQSPTEFLIDGDGDKLEVVAEWLATDDRTRRAWANELDTTRDGAYAFALAAVECSAGLFAVHRAQHGSGADYYIAPLGYAAEDLEECIRLEVSGVDANDRGLVKQRLAEKLKQAARGDSNLPAMAGIVGFGARVVLLARLEKQ